MGVLGIRICRIVSSTHIHAPITSLSRVHSEELVLCVVGWRYCAGPASWVWAWSFLFVYMEQEIEYLFYKHGPGMGGPAGKGLRYMSEKVTATISVFHNRVTRRDI